MKRAGAVMTALTAANQLTLLRMLLIPVLALLVLYDRMGWALVVLVLAALTDLLDGYLARRDGPTTLGAWLDPVADKLLIATMFVLLTLPLPQLVQRVPLWLTVLVMSRDIGIVVTVAIVNLAVGHRTFPPSIFGKAATATFMLTAVLTLWANYVNEPMFLVDLFAYASLALTVISALHYAAYITGFVGVGAANPER